MVCSSSMSRSLSWDMSALQCEDKRQRTCSLSPRMGIAFREHAFRVRNCVRHFLLRLSSSSTATQFSRGVASQSFSHFYRDS